ncbi:hypothetical protein D1007_54576 [Hordeum vulgare]|nr:hypothetical protein D1007_54576 [Hordeum vulgare]
MAAAALWFAARSLRGGVLGQTRTRVVELGQRRLMPRSISRPRYEPSQQRNICTGGKTEKDVVMKRIDKAKEELFDLSAEAHKMYRQDPEPACRNNLELLRDLFHHVKRRPDDPVWCYARQIFYSLRVGMDMHRALASLGVMVASTDARTGKDDADLSS